MEMAATSILATDDRSRVSLGGAAQAGHAARDDFVIKFHMLDVVFQRALVVMGTDGTDRLAAQSLPQENVRRFFASNQQYFRCQQSWPQTDTVAPSRDCGVDQSPTLRLTSSLAMSTGAYHVAVVVTRLPVPMSPRSLLLSRTQREALSAFAGRNEQSSYPT
jgi:hypothetical protein